jgi:hypothetical protein
MQTGRRHMLSQQKRGVSSSERRGHLNPIPLNLRGFLNSEQNRALRQVESFGWRLAFVRRELFHQALVVICNAEGSEYSTIEADGFINAEPPEHFRI